METGVIYLTRSTPSALWWFLNKKFPGSIEILWKPSIQTLRAALNYSSVFDDQKALVIYPNTPDIPTDLDIDPNLTAFIWLSEPDGNLNKKAEKTFKSTGGVYRALDLRSQNYLADSLLTSALEQLPIDTRNSLIKDFINNPWRCLWQAQQLDPLLYECSDNEESEALKLIKELGTKEGLISWANMSRKLMYSLFLTPEQERSGMYLILAGGGSKKYGKCPSLWCYYSLFFSALSKKFHQEPNKLLSLFATWVYMTNNLWAAPYYKGLYEFNKKSGGKGLEFRPSPTAQQEFFRLIRSPILSYDVLAK